MNNELYKIALDACKQVYKHNIDLGTTEYMYSRSEYLNKPLQVIAVAGTNEGLDWVKNLDVRDIQGIKRSGVTAANEMLGDLNWKRWIDPNIPILITGHSKGTATAVAYMKLYGADYCVLFNPVRCLSRSRDNTMKNTTMFLDKEDVVSKLAWLSFKLPKCKIIKKPRDARPWWDIKTNHGLSSWNEIIG